MRTLIPKFIIKNILLEFFSFENMNLVNHLKLNSKPLFLCNNGQMVSVPIASFRDHDYMT